MSQSRMTTIRRTQEEIDATEFIRSHFSFAGESIARRFAVIEFAKQLGFTPPAPGGQSAAAPAPKSRTRHGSIKARLHTRTQNK